MPESATRLVSLHDPDARPIRKGRRRVILHHNIERGNPPDAPQLAPAIKRITSRTGFTSIHGARTWRGHGVFAHNLVKIGTLAT